MIYNQLRENHPLLQMIERCLDFPEDRPSIREVLSLLEQARAEDTDKHTDMNKLELVQALHTQPSNQVSQYMHSLYIQSDVMVEYLGNFRAKEATRDQ